MHLFLVCIFLPYTRIYLRAVILRISHFYHFEGWKSTGRDRQNEVSENDIFFPTLKLHEMCRADGQRPWAATRVTFSMQGPAEASQSVRNVQRTPAK